MKYLKNKTIKIILIITIVWLLLFLTDFILVNNEKKPLFCPIKLGGWQDGGTLEYYRIRI